MPGRHVCLLCRQENRRCELTAQFQRLAVLLGSVLCRGRCYECCPGVSATSFKLGKQDLGRRGVAGEDLDEFMKLTGKFTGEPASEMTAFGSVQQPYGSLPF